MFDPVENDEILDILTSQMLGDVTNDPYFGCLATVEAIMDFSFDDVTPKSAILDGEIAHTGRPSIFWAHVPYTALLSYAEC